MADDAGYLEMEGRSEMFMWRIDFSPYVIKQEVRIWKLRKERAPGNPNLKSSMMRCLPESVISTPWMKKLLQRRKPSVRKSRLCQFWV